MRSGAAPALGVRKRGGGGGPLQPTWGMGGRVYQAWGSQHCGVACPRAGVIANGGDLFDCRAMLT